MTLNEIALALTAWMWLQEVQRIVDKGKMTPFMAKVHLVICMFAIVYLFYFMGKSVWCYFGK